MSNTKSDKSQDCCSESASAELKIYQAFIFSIPIFFTFLLLLFFYLFYLRRRRVDWSSLGMRGSVPNDIISRIEFGLKKEVREMLPIIIFNESFFVKDTQCSVCLGDYQSDDKLQQIPACGHTFHMECIDLWLATRTTCPLCRLSLIPSHKASSTEPLSEQDQVQVHDREQDTEETGSDRQRNDAQNHHQEDS